MSDCSFCSGTGEGPTGNACRICRGRGSVNEPDEELEYTSASVSDDYEDEEVSL